MKQHHLFENLKLDEERALYGVKGAVIRNCTFDGPRDGESALKESRNILVTGSEFRLRYPLWHVHGADMENSRMTQTCRAALWYSRNVRLKNCRLNGVKAVRETEDIAIEDTEVISSEFGWLSKDIRIRNSEIESDYLFFHSSDIQIDDAELKGKYSFQYVQNAEIRNSRLDTKDAFWHSTNVTVTNCVIKGEYLGWYSQNLRLVRCRIIGTQPLCYAKNLILEDCEMVDCDLAFEKSDVHAVVKGTIDSVKNPSSGHIYADAIGEVIMDEEQLDQTPCIIETKANKQECLCVESA